jgi:hypothetical protein
MARIKLEGIIDYLERDLQRALEATVRADAAHSEADARRLFEQFRQNVRRQCRDWERVPDRFVDVD